MQIIQNIAAWGSEQLAGGDDAEVRAVYNGMTRCSNFTLERGAEALPRWLDYRCIRGR
ncbi:hypothetical protein J2Y88_001498 [Pseudomonas chlororaphis]|nr:hypothetical protein [Pseudomonas chlororaphis]MCP1594461.1 hypothetical protein [Pseudomonas chlororaphis]